MSSTSAKQAVVRSGLAQLAMPGCQIQEQALHLAGSHALSINAAYLAPGAQAIVAGVLAVEIAGELVLAAVRARFSLHSGCGDKHLLLVAHRIHLCAAGPAAEHEVHASVD
jgi:hypothetical protein